MFLFHWSLQLAIDFYTKFSDIISSVHLFLLYVCFAAPSFLSRGSKTVELFCDLDKRTAPMENYFWNCFIFLVLWSSSRNLTDTCSATTTTGAKRVTMPKRRKRGFCKEKELGCMDGLGILECDNSSHLTWGQSGALGLFSYYLGHGKAELL